MCIIAQVYFRLEKDLIFFIFDFRIDRIRLMYSFLFLFLFFSPLKGNLKKIFYCNEMLLWDFIGRKIGKFN